MHVPAGLRVIITYACPGLPLTGRIVRMAHPNPGCARDKITNITKDNGPNISNKPLLLPRFRKIVTRIEVTNQLFSSNLKYS